MYLTLSAIIILASQCQLGVNIMGTACELYCAAMNDYSRPAQMVVRLEIVC